MTIHIINDQAYVVFWNGYRVVDSFRVTYR